MLKHWQGYHVYSSQAKFKEEDGVQEFVHQASMMGKEQILSVAESDQLWHSVYNAETELQNSGAELIRKNTPKLKLRGSKNIA